MNNKINISKRISEVYAPQTLPDRLGYWLMASASSYMYHTFQRIQYTVILFE